MQVSGRLTTETLGGLFAEAMRPLEGKSWLIDLAQVEMADSSAVSLLLAWLRNAQRNGATVEFTGMPANLRSLAEMYGVAETLPIKQ